MPVDVGSRIPWIGPSQRALIKSIAAPVGAAAANRRPKPSARLIGRTIEDLSNRPRVHAFLDAIDVREVHILPAVFSHAAGYRSHLQTRSSGPEVFVL